METHILIQYIGSFGMLLICLISAIHTIRNKKEFPSWELIVAIWVLAYLTKPC